MGSFCAENLNHQNNRLGGRDNRPRSCVVVAVPEPDVLEPAADDVAVVGR